MNSEETATPLDVTVAGGHFEHVVVGTQIVNKSTVVHHHETRNEASDLAPGHFRLSSHITVSELYPINRDSRIYRAKLHSKILGDLDIAVKIQSDGERQRREARIHFMVPHHRNIVERILTDTFKYQGQSCIYIAMEQCDAQNLHAYVVSLAEANAPYDAEMFMSFAFQIATGLEFLHRHKILNRNLKPENILLSRNKTIAKIADFGMSKEMIGEAATVSALQPGTDGWRSPEILNNDERITLASDIFSLGLIFHFLWSYGKHAFGDDPHAWNLYIKRGINMVLDGLKILNINAARALLTSMFKQNPVERPNALEVLRNEIFRGPRLRSDAAAIYREVSEMQVVDTIKNRGELNKPQQGSPSFLGKIWRKFEKKPVKKTASSKSGKSEDGPPSPAIESDQVFQETLQNFSAMEKYRGKNFMNVTDCSPDSNAGLLKTSDEKEELTTSMDLSKKNITFQKTIGFFAFGNVWKGEVDGREAVIFEYGKQDTDVEQGFDEAIIAFRSLRHENVIKYLGMHTAHPRAVVAEFLRHGTMLEYLTNGDGKHATLYDIRRMAGQVAAGMSYIHLEGFIHRDLRAGNIMVGENLHCKISGLAQARRFNDSGQYEFDGVMKMPVAWAAPETFTAQCNTRKSDVWSFGVLLIEMTSGGQEPYQGKSEDEKMDLVKSGHHLPRPSRCPANLYRIIKICWSMDPDNRPTFDWLEKSIATFTHASGEDSENNFGKTVRGIYDFEARDDAELSFKNGDIILDVRQEKGEMWWLGTLHGIQALFPSNYVVEIK